MPENHSDNCWDEYDWERFLQDQERRTEKYMGLVEKYMDHPDRDAIIAREMGWTHMIDGDSREWEDEVESSFEDAESGTTEEAQPGFAFEKHPLYREALAFTAELDEMFSGVDEQVREHPAVIDLHSQATLATAKLAAALNDDDIDELGMTIAYLKRALKAISSAMEAALDLRRETVIDDARCATLNQRLFQIRDAIIDLMGSYRAEFRRRFGAI